MKSFVISRSTWHRGKGAMGSKLLIPETGKMCCLGQIAEQCGADPKQLTDISSPAKLFNERKVRLNGFTDVLTKPGFETTDDYEVRRTTDVCDTLMRINDDRDISDAEREVKLITTAIDELDWAITFTD